jgi:lipoprotein-anchoring transpeptidase ErfK/SrfK
VPFVRPGFFVALVAALLAAGVSLAFTASASRARQQRAGAAAASVGRAPVHPLSPITDVPGGVAATPAQRQRALSEPVELIRVRAGRALALRDRPGGRVVATLGDRTEFGSPTTLSVLSRRGRWASVPSSALANGRFGWVDTRDGAVARGTSEARITVRLSSRTIELRVRGRLVRRVTVAVGRPGATTPHGRFSVTDKIAGTRFGPYYGCCILALSGHQPHTPPGWTGGDRLAIHGTDAPSTIGTASSAGCLRAADADLRVLMRRVPLGTPVLVRE